LCNCYGPFRKKYTNEKGKGMEYQGKGKGNTSKVFEGAIEEF
jgi:hypothetical protein